MEKQKHLNHSITSFTILSISLMIASGNAISPALPAMSKAFPNLSTNTVDLVGTIQQFAVIFSLFIATGLSKKIGIKKTIEWGLILVFLSGIIPLFFPSFSIILIDRIILGIGVGFFNSLAIDIINLYYQNDNKKRIQMSGARSAFEPLGQCVLNLIAGFLVGINWQASFLIYLLALPILFLLWRFVPTIQTNPEPKPKKKHQLNNIKSNNKINWLVIGLAFLMMFLVMCNTTINIQIPNIFGDKHLGSSEFASLVISINTLGAMLMGFGFGKVYQHFHRFTLALGILFMASGTFIIALSNTSLTLIIGSILGGLAFPLSGSYAYALIGTIVPKKSQELVISILLVGCNTGTFISPIITGILGRTGTSFNIEHAFLIMSTILIIITIVVSGFQIISNTYHQIHHFKHI